MAQERFSVSFYGLVECGSPIPALDFASLMKGYFSLYFYENYTGLYVVYTDVISLIFLSLLCWLCICLSTTMYGSHHVSTCKLMNNVSMN